MFVMECPDYIHIYMQKMYRGRIMFEYKVTSLTCSIWYWHLLASELSHRRTTLSLALIYRKVSYSYLESFWWSGQRHSLLQIKRVLLLYHFISRSYKIILFYRDGIAIANDLFSGWFMVCPMALVLYWWTTLFTKVQSEFNIQGVMMQAQSRVTWSQAECATHWEFNYMQQLYLYSVACKYGVFNVVQTVFFKTIHSPNYIYFQHKYCQLVRFKNILPNEKLS